MNIADPGLGYVSAGAEANGIGSADNAIVSLGDNGIATLTFAAPLYDGPGADFAVFENGFQNPSDPEFAFLELAFVEVSSDGINYFRFPAHSLTSDTTQIPGAGVFMKARLLNNLAGKYISGYGTPFDLSELSGIPGLDISYITHIRLVDVIGTVTGIGTIDTAGNVINDPYPTDFPTVGFDLDAVGAIHQYSTGVTATSSGVKVTVYPNPVSDKLLIETSSQCTVSATLTDISGKVLLNTSVHGHCGLSLAQYATGLYYLLLTDKKGARWVEKIIKQ
jgi:hypothetical protein